MQAERDQIQSYLQCISSEDSLLQSYRILFIAIETIIFGLAYVLYKTGNIKTLAWTGIAFCAIWMIVCIHRACIVDRLKDEIEQLLKGNCTDLKGWFNLAYGKASTTECRKLKYLIHTFGKPLEKCIPRIIFNLVTPACIIILWILVLVKKLLYGTMPNIPYRPPSPHLNQETLHPIQVSGWQYPLYIIVIIVVGWLITYYLYPKFSHKLTLRRELDTAYLVDFKKWCRVLYKNLIEFKERYVRDEYEGTYNQFSKTLIIIDYRELHDVLREAGRYLGKIEIEKEKREVARYLRELANSIDNLWHDLQDNFSVNFDQSDHDEWIKAIIEYPKKEEFVKEIIEKKKHLNQTLLKKLGKEKEFKEVKEYLLDQFPTD